MRRGRKRSRAVLIRGSLSCPTVGKVTHLSIQYRDRLQMEPPPDEVFLVLENLADQYPTLAREVERRKPAWEFARTKMAAGPSVRKEFVLP
jgi:hypothetical protein